MSILGSAAKLFGSKEAKAFGFIADLAWQMYNAQKSGDDAKNKLDAVLQWAAKVFGKTVGEKYETLRAAIIELIASVKKVVNLVKEIN